MWLFQYHYSRSPSVEYAQCFLRIAGASVKRLVYTKDFEISLIKLYPQNREGYNGPQVGDRNDRPVIETGWRGERILRPKQCLVPELVFWPSLDSPKHEFWGNSQNRRAGITMLSKTLKIKVSVYRSFLQISFAWQQAYRCFTFINRLSMASGPNVLTTSHHCGNL